MKTVIKYRKMANALKLLLLLTLISLTAPNRSFAYLDPGTGSYIIQLFIGGALGSVYLIKIYWKEIKNKTEVFKKKFLKKNDDQNNNQ